MVVTGADEGVLFAPLALRLAPRALPWHGSRLGAERLAFALALQGLAAPERAELEQLAGARPTPFLPAGGASDPPELLVTPERPALVERAPESPLARLLLATQAALERAPGPPRLMGIVNVTPDSFSDGGRWSDPARAIEHGLALAAEGADWIDVGGESTRPGAVPVGEREELARVLPVVRGLVEAGVVRVSIDTTKAAVARAALEAGAAMVNDVSAGRAEPAMLELAAQRGCGYVLMHMLGTPRTMQRDPRYGDVVAEVAGFLRARTAECLKAGIALHKIVLDPGIGFGKRLVHNLLLLRRLAELRGLGRPLLLGVSRKAFIAHATRLEAGEGAAAGAPPSEPRERLGGTAAAVAAAVLGGAELLRVHDVRVMAEAAGVARALRDAATLRPND